MTRTTAAGDRTGSDRTASGPTTPAPTATGPTAPGSRPARRRRSALPASTFVPPEPPAFSTASRRERTARIVTEVLAPAHLVTALLLLVGAHSNGGWAGVGWGLFAALFCGAVPIGVVALGVRRGALTDRHIRIRRQRVVPMAVGLLSVVTGVALLHLLHAPAPVGALVVAMLVGLVSALVVTVWWQISLHNAVAGGTAMILLLAFGPAPAAAGLPAALPAGLLPVAVAVPVAVGWSRLVLKAHTPAQVLAGTALGGVSALVFALLR
ncbi:phosphatase PAP2 family protein [Kitasatospora sp. NBC_00458]|uniref:phosphatase PAP2 family protein n=1 Tax=Kitasatospora sp. NBC_00458 TaxID=2903568 RepID=UPI002E18D4A9